MVCPNCGSANIQCAQNDEGFFRRFKNKRENEPEAYFCMDCSYRWSADPMDEYGGPDAAPYDPTYPEAPYSDATAAPRKAAGGSLWSRPSHSGFNGPEDVRPAEPIEPQAFEPIEPQAFEPIEPQAFEPIEPQAFEPGEPQAFEPAEPQAFEPAEEGWICPNCSGKNKPTYRFCCLCGEPRAIVEPPARRAFCTECGTELVPEAVFCPNCGTKR